MSAKPERGIVRVFSMVLILFAISECPNQQANRVGDAGLDNPSATGATVFKCEQQEGNWVTVVQTDGTQIPTIGWQTTEFGPQWTPEQRCKTVSGKLAQAVDRGDGSVASLDLATGQVNKYTVVCAKTAGEGSCNPDNMLFTLNRENAKKYQQVLTDLSSFDPVDASNVPIVE